MSFPVLIGIYVVLNALGQLLIKMGALDMKQVTGLMDLLTNYKLMIGIFLFGLSFMTWIYILTKSNLSYAFPFAVGLGYVAVIALSVTVLREHVNNTQIAGILLVGLGVVMMSLSRT